MAKRNYCNTCSTIQKRLVAAPLVVRIVTVFLKVCSALCHATLLNCFREGWSGVADGVWGLLTAVGVMDFGLKCS